MAVRAKRRNLLSSARNAVVLVAQWLVRRPTLSLVLAAYLVTLAPSIVALARGPWQTDQESHGPFIVGAAVLLALRHARTLLHLPAKPASFAGWFCLFIGLLMLVLGRSQHMLSIEVAAQMPILTGLVLLFAGWQALKFLAGPILFLVFMIPLPGWALDYFTIPLKIHVSDFVVALLYDAGLPVAQNGVILMIGQYELLVRDACAGMNSIFSLSAISMFYISQVSNRSLWHKLILVACVLPVSFIANVVRVIALVLLTYYFGDAAGRGIAHESTGILLFSVALASIFLLDYAGLGIAALIRSARRRRQAAS